MLKEMTLTPACYIVLITRGHSYDEPCLRAIIHSRAKYIGMIGSRRRSSLLPRFATKIKLLKR
jgi:xanthine dehydrogenase accessory factor